MESYDLDNLSRVWLRVKGSDQKEAPGDGFLGKLRTYINMEAAHADMYTLLAIKSKGGPAERVFKRAAEDERRHEKLLQTEYFLLSGDTLVPDSIKPSAAYLIEAVRQQYMEELRGAAGYEKEARSAADARTAALFTQLTRDERRHAAAMRALVERLMG